MFYNRLIHLFLPRLHRGPHGYADMNISVLLKFHGYEYGYALDIVTYVLPT
jgi:hypothetical protein